MARVHCMIYIVALNDYDRVLYEDRNVNSMLESVQVFEELICQKYFRYSEIVLLLNKDDIFRRKLRIDKIPLNVCFGESSSVYVNHKWPYQDEYWTIPHFEENPNLSNKENDENFELFHDQAVEFIINIFEKRMRNSPIHTNKRLYKHVISATNSSDVEKVFVDVQKVVSHLYKYGKNVI